MIRAVGTRLLDVGALGLELGDVVAGREGLVAGAAHTMQRSASSAESAAIASPERCHIAG